MCLYTTQKKPMIAVNDIVCYKICLKLKEENIFVAPYVQKYIYRIGELHTEPDFQCEAESVWTYGPTAYNKVDKGFHSFVNKYDAMRFIFEFSDRIIFKCIIPKGSRYYHGEYNSNGDSYCSDSIIIGVDKKPYMPSLLERFGYSFIDICRTMVNGIKSDMKKYRKNNILKL